MTYYATNPWTAAPDYDGRIGWQVNEDLADLQAASDLCHALVDIGPALSRSEIDIAAAKLDAMQPWHDDAATAISNLIDVIQHYHARLLGAWDNGNVTALQEDLQDDLDAQLEDVDAILRNSE